VADDRDGNLRRTQRRRVRLHCEADRRHARERISGDRPFPRTRMLQSNRRGEDADGIRATASARSFRIRRPQRVTIQFETGDPLECRALAGGLRARPGAARAGGRRDQATCVGASRFFVPSQLSRSIAR
jgi:hypothetical protein